MNYFNLTYWIIKLYHGVMKKTLLNPYSPEDLSEKYNSFIDTIDKYFSGDRRNKLKKLYSEQNYGQELVLAPASGKLNFHNCYVGGYIDHINNVINNSLKSMKFYEFAGGTIDFTEEEVVFAAMHHDLGKLGDENGPYYIHQESRWHQENKHEYYIHNPKLQWMKPPDRALYILNKFEISMTMNEMLAIKLADGLYDDCNEFYLKVYDPNKALKTSLPYVIHMGDFISCQTERDRFLRKHSDLIFG
jgi:hypothetical protein